MPRKGTAKKPKEQPQLVPFLYREFEPGDKDDTNAATRGSKGDVVLRLVCNGSTQQIWTESLLRYDVIGWKSPGSTRDRFIAPCEGGCTLTSYDGEACVSLLAFSSLRKISPLIHMPVPSGELAKKEFLSEA